jgi:hypothetical protein
LLRIKVWKWKCRFRARLPPKVKKQTCRTPWNYNKKVTQSHTSPSHSTADCNLRVAKRNSTWSEYEVESEKDCEVMWMWGICECEVMWMWRDVKVRWCECEVM